MMSLTRPSLGSVVKKQYVYKLKAYLGSFVSLLVVQVLAILFSRNGVGSSSTGTNDFSIIVHTYSADLVLAFTFVWAFITGLLLTTKAHRYPDFSFVTNRLSSNLANIYYLVTASLIAGASAMLSGYVVKMSIHYFSDQLVVGSHLFLPLPEFMLGVVAASLYVLLFCAAGYFVGSLVQLHPVLPLLVTVSFVGFLFLGARSRSLLEHIFQFFLFEPSLIIFTGKVIISALLLFVGAMLLSNRMEVRA